MLCIYLPTQLFVYPSGYLFPQIHRGEGFWGEFPELIGTTPCLFLPQNNTCFWTLQQHVQLIFFWVKRPPQKIWYDIFFPYFVCKWRMCVSDVIFACVSDVPAFFRVRIANLWHFFLEAPKDSPGCLNRTLANKCHQSKVNQKVIWSKELGNWCSDIL